MEIIILAKLFSFKMHYLKLLLALLPAIIAAPTVTDDDDIIEGAYIVTLKQKLDEKKVEQHIDWVDGIHNGSVFRRTEDGVKLVWNETTYKGYSGDFDKQTIKEIKKSKDVSQLLLLWFLDIDVARSLLLSLFARSIFTRPSLSRDRLGVSALSRIALLISTITFMIRLLALGRMRMLLILVSISGMTSFRAGLLWVTMLILVLSLSMPMVMGHIVLVLLLVKSMA